MLLREQARGVWMVYLVCLVGRTENRFIWLVWFVSFIWLADRKISEARKPDKQNKPDRPDRPSPIPKKERASVGEWDGQPGQRRDVHGRAMNSMH